MSEGLAPTIQAIAEYIHDEKIPQRKRGRICRLIESFRLSELEDDELFIVYDALGLIERDKYAEAIYTLVDLMKTERIKK